MIRRSLADLNPKMVKKDNYPGLPEVLREFNYYLDDSGHCIMAIPECLLPEAEKNGDLELFEVPVPVKYIIENGCYIYKKHVICDVEYDPIFGMVVPDEYREF